MKTYVLKRKCDGKYLNNNFGYTKFIGKAKVFQRSLHFLNGYKNNLEDIVEIVIKEK